MKKLLIGLLVGMILFVATPIYALTINEAEEFVDKYVLVTAVYGKGLIGMEVSGNIGKVLLVETIEGRDGYLTQTYLVILGLDKSIDHVPIDRIENIREIDPISLSVLKVETPKIIEKEER